MTIKDQRESVQGEDAPQFVTKEDLIQLVSQTVNSAISSRNTAFEKKIEALLTAKVAPQEQIEDSGVKPGRVPNAELMAMKKQLDDLKAEKQAEVTKNRDSQLRNNLREQLTKAGVAPHLIKAAIATLVDADKSVSYTTLEYADDKDQIVFRDGKQEVELAAGISKWIKSEEGSSFLAPRGAQGSGDRSYNSGNKTAQQPISDNALADMLRNAF
jgi:hypothetical protein